jgi:hypothetical protein
LDQDRGNFESRRVVQNRKEESWERAGDRVGNVRGSWEEEGERIRGCGYVSVKRWYFSH